MSDEKFYEKAEERIHDWLHRDGGGIDEALMNRRKVAAFEMDSETLSVSMN